MLCYVNKMTCIQFVAMFFFSGKYYRNASEKHKGLLLSLFFIVLEACAVIGLQ